MKVFAYLRQDSPFAGIFPKGVPILEGSPGFALLIDPAGGLTQEDVYMVDLDRVSDEQFAKTLAIVQEQCGPDVPLETARKEIRANGLPMRKKHVAFLRKEAGNESN